MVDVFLRMYYRRSMSCDWSFPMTPKDWAILARDAYTKVPDIGSEASAGRIVFAMLPDGLALTIPGTNNESCALADVDAIPHDAGECGFVHKGIWEAFEPVWEAVSQLAVHALVGHSEGASGAIYLAARLCLIRKAPKIVWAWEPPRTSIDEKLAELLSAHSVELHIMWHGNDLVPSIPWELPLLEWQHAGPIQKFGKASASFPNIEDHMMTNILADL